MQESRNGNPGYNVSRINWKHGTPVDILPLRGNGPCNFGKTISPVFLNRAVVRCLGGTDTGKIRIYPLSRLSASK